MSTGTIEGAGFRLADLPRSVAGRVVKLPREIADVAAARGRDVWLAGLGALATAESEGAAFFQALVEQGETLVERGEEMEKRGRARVEELKAGVTARRGEVAQKVEAGVVDPVVEAVRRLGVPTRAEVQQLSAQVEALTQRVNLLLATLQARPADAEEEPAIEVVSA